MTDPTTSTDLPSWLDAAFAQQPARDRPATESPSDFTLTKEPDLSPADADATDRLAAVPAAGVPRDDAVTGRGRAGAEPVVVREVVTQRAISPWAPFRRLLSPRFYGLVAFGTAALWVVGLFCGQPWLSAIALPIGIGTVTCTLGNALGRLVAGTVRTGQNFAGMVRGGGSR